MSVVGLIVHLGRDQASVHARDLARWLIAEGHEVRVPPDDASTLADTGNVALDPQVVAASQFCEGLDLVVTLGGDGSILRAVELLAGKEIPILGVNHGRLGYLTEVAPDEAQGAIARALRGSYDIEERMLVQTELTVDGKTSTHLALNEAVIERTSEANTVRLAVSIDGEFFTTYAADGLIVASPTGSTAYAFSARGPIIDATHRALLLTPVAPHMPFDRALVLAAETRLRLSIDGHRPAGVSVDGRRLMVIGDGDAIECTAADQAVHLVTFGPRRFQRVLKAKFGLNDR
ncbi:MAG: NAD(+)/NADH kinase [Acidimicrobiaceae bacterium]|nr:NAD(+)/NADH kinase [Acidimicrobiaceae bacterium]MXW74738.1 NAD(+)/NADH kinase [Acidimicrobiaceae bacterium]MYC42069.1 NAD(+)/NADH kinase [Acidimicrobiaceae bacterium]MYD07969.1 NAD(+)/NADH kinase [Acidimicrobiaceae bacterium]MYH87578.1 NAD(+)/NADH kinase [Acidimicrobiaceae bacterium]